MENHNAKNNFQMDDPRFQVPIKLIIKNIPSNLSDAQIEDIFKKNFANEIEGECLIVKLDKKYTLKRRSKVCFVTAKTFQIRDKIYEFFSTFELIDPNGIKQKLSVNDCIVQENLYVNNSKDPIENSIENFDHFKKFQEYFEKEKLIDFKNEEDKCKKELIINV